MKKITFKLFCMMLITSYSLQAQENKSYSEYFNTDRETAMILNLDNSHVLIEPSTDGKVSVDYNFKFEGFSKKELIKKIESISVKATSFENTITIRANEIPEEQKYYAYDGKGAIFIDDDIFGTSNKNDSIVRKSKDSILNELRFSRLKPMSFTDNKFKIKEADGSIVNLRDRSKTKIVKGSFVIKLPPYIKLIINAKDSYVNFKGDITNELYITLNKGGLDAVKLMNRYNKIKLTDASIRIEQLLGGNYGFNNVKNGLIAALGNVTITSEFSKIELGEIAKGTYIMDFNSEYWCYNFTKDFERFYMRSGIFENSFLLP